MVLLPAGLLVGKALMDNITKRANPSHVARTSATIGSLNPTIHQRRKVIRNTNANPFAKDEVLHRMGGTSIRRSHIQRERDAQLLKDALEDEKWVAVYRYPGIRFGVLLARAKLFQTVASVLYLPYVSWNYMNGIADSNWFYSSMAIAIAAPLLLIVFSRYLNRLIGVIAMNESNEYIRIGYLTFWGARKNRYLEVGDVLPLSEMGGNKSDSLVRFTWLSSGSGFLYLPIKNAEIVDIDRAELLFGDLSIFESAKKKY